MRLPENLTNFTLKNRELDLMKNIIEYYEFQTDNTPELEGKPYIDKNKYPYAEMAQRIAAHNANGFRVALMTPALKYCIGYYQQGSHDAGATATCGLFVCFESED